MSKIVSFSIIPIAALFVLFISLISTPNAMSSEKTPAKLPDIPAEHDYIDLGAGCFWCVESVYQRIDGITSATSGYMGGDTANPTYKDICRGDTNHAEIVRVVFDPKKITTEKVLEWFWKLHDPTTLNRQGGDVGTQYRSAIFYHSEAQKKIAEASKAKANTDFNGKIVTEITKASTFYPAEVYHQDFYSLNGNTQPYCKLVILPKLKKLKLTEKKEKTK